MKQKVINLFAGPGAGKSTTAAGLFYLMKLANYKVELVTEYAKDITYEGGMKKLQNQAYVFGKQLHRLERVSGHVEWIITDSPLPLAVLYAPDDYPESFDQFAIDIFNKYDNHNIFIERVKEYQRYGRSQEEHEARIIDAQAQQLLRFCQLPYVTIPGDTNAPRAICNHLGLAV